MVDSFHQGLIIDGYFICKILVETWLQRDKLGERWEVIHLFYNAEHNRLAECRNDLARLNKCDILHTFPGQPSEYEGTHNNQKKTNQKKHLKISSGTKLLRKRAEAS